MLSRVSTVYVNAGGNVDETNTLAQIDLRLDHPGLCERNVCHASFRSWISIFYAALEVTPLPYLAEVEHTKKCCSTHRLVLS